MNPAYPLKIYQILQKYFNNENDSRILVEEIQHTVEETFQQQKDQLSTKSEVEEVKKEIEILRKDVELMELRLNSTILKSESNLKSEINKLIVWIVATMFGAGALFITIAKVFFDK